MSRARAMPSARGRGKLSGTGARLALLLLFALRACVAVFDIAQFSQVVQTQTARA